MSGHWRRVSASDSSIDIITVLTSSLFMVGARSNYLLDIGIQLAAPRDGQAHSDRGRVRQAGVVSRDNVFGGERHARGRTAACLEPLKPPAAGPYDRHFDEAFLPQKVNAPLVS
jgi:hypothetical protein